MAAYYNENEPYAAMWLRNLIVAGHIAPGDVDERSIADVMPSDLIGYTQCHFFAGIGGWSIALRLAEWPDDQPVWTGSCPCQPFSGAGKRSGAADERHLWPHWFRLIRECKPAVLFGEQVDAAIRWGWLDAVCADLESEGYATGAAVLPAYSVGAPHIRQRVWFVADADQGRGGRHTGAISGAQGETEWRLRGEPDGAELGGAAGELGDARGPRLQEQERNGRVQREALEPSAGQAAIGGSDAGELVDPASEQVGLSGRARQPRATADGCGRPSAWSDCDWLLCTDGKARPVEPGTFPLAHGIPGRVGRLRAYGNAIIPQVAARFIEAYQTRNED